MEVLSSVSRRTRKGVMASLMAAVIIEDMGWSSCGGSCVLAAFWCFSPLAGDADASGVGAGGGAVFLGCGDGDGSWRGGETSV